MGSTKRSAMQRINQQASGTGAHCQELPVVSSLADLPDELILSHILGELNYMELSRFAISSRRTSKLSSCNKLWKALFVGRWGDATPQLYEDAAKLCGSWRNLMRSKHQMDASSGGWTRPCEFELKAALQKLACTAKGRCQGSKSAGYRDAPASPTSHMNASPALSPAPSTSICSRSTTMSGSLDAGTSLSGSPSRAFTSRLAPQASIQSRDILSSSPSSSCGCSTFTDHDEDMLTRSFTTLTVPPPLSPPPEVQIVYLLDGSGSVSEEDFNEMRRFVCISAPIIFETLGVGNKGKVGVIQFSTEPRLEVPLAALDNGVTGLATTLEAMIRMNGGTNIATAIARAGAVMKAGDQAVLNAANNLNNPPQPPPPGMEPPPLPDAAGMASPPPPPPPLPPPPGLHGDPSITMEEALSMSMLLGMHGEAMDAVETELVPHRQQSSVLRGNGGLQRPIRLLLLLTDGRVDSYQAREAHTTACRLTDELWGCTLAAFGVGRGVDRAELLHIIDTPDGDASTRYLDLMVRDDAPW